MSVHLHIERLVIKDAPRGVSELVLRREIERCLADLLSASPIERLRPPPLGAATATSFTWPRRGEAGGLAHRLAVAIRDTLVMEQAP